jgi:O-antigen/teichoic acid export membrane protein
LNIEFVSSRVAAGFNRVRKGEFTRKVSMLAGATAGAYAINLAIAPVLTRIYGVPAFGHLQVYASLMGFIVTLIALRYELSVLLPEEDEVAANLVAVSFATIVLMTAFIAAAVFFALHYHLLWRRAAELGNYLWLLPVGAFGVGVYQLLNTWGLRYHAYKAVAASKFSQVGAQAIVQIGAGLATHGSMGGLIAGDACGRISGSLRIARITFRHDWHRLSQIRLATMWRAAKRYRDFPLVLTGAGVINSAGLQMVPLLLSVYYAPEVLGLYAVTDRTMLIPGVLVGQAVSQVYMVKAAQLRTTNPLELRSLFTKIVSRSLLLGIGPLLLLCAIAPTLFAFVFGEPWRMAGVYARVLAPVYYLCFIHTCTGMTLNMLERQRWQLAWDTLRLIAVTSTVVLGALAGLGSTQLLATFAVVSAAAYALHILLCYRAIALCQRRHGAPQPMSEIVAVSEN